MSDLRPGHNEETVQNFGWSLAGYIDASLAATEYASGDSSDRRNRLKDILSDLRFLDLESEENQRAVAQRIDLDGVQTGHIVRVDPDVQTARSLMEHTLREVIFTLGDVVSAYVVARDSFYKTIGTAKLNAAMQDTTMDEPIPDQK